MDFNEKYQQLYQIFEQKEINYKLIKELKEKSISDINTTLKRYLLEFLIDPEDKKTTIKSDKDIWFINDDEKIKHLASNYFDLMVKIINNKKYFSMNVFKEMEIFINTEIGKRLNLKLPK